MNWVMLPLSPQIEARQHPALPVRKETLRAVHLSVGDFEGDDLVGVCCKQQELEPPILRLLPLLKGRHEAVTRLGALLNFWVVHLQERQLAGETCALFTFFQWAKGGIPYSWRAWSRCGCTEVTRVDTLLWSKGALHLPSAMTPSQQAAAAAPYTAMMPSQHTTAGSRKNLTWPQPAAARLLHGRLTIGAAAAAA